MINLLPSQLKEAYRYGRINRHLVHWIIAFAIGILGAAIITGFGYLYLDNTAKTYATQIDNANKQLEKQNLKGVQQEVKSISNNLQLAVDVLSKQVLFSELLSRLSELMPANTNLTGLSITQTQGGIDILAAAKENTDASQIQVNLTDPKNQLFSKADIVSINCSGATAYPCNVNIKALFSSKNPYLFTNNLKKQ